MLLAESRCLLKLGSAGVCLCLCVRCERGLGGSAWQASGGVRRYPIINQNTAQG